MNKNRRPGIAVRWQELCILLLFIPLLFSLAYSYEALSKEEMQALAGAYPPQLYLNATDANGFLEPILIVRIPGTENSTKVQNHFKSFFESLSSDWKLEFDRFEDQTPRGPRNFTNVIATRDPPGVPPGSVGRLTLVAHYDSKIEPQGFLGATDSAVPCALIMYAVKSIDEALSRKWAADTGSRFGQHETGIQVIFLDGEEAIEEWTDTDSIYGARHLAEMMDTQVHSARSVRRSQLDNIDVLILLDLIGTSNPLIYSYYKSTNWIYNNLAAAQKSIKEFGLSQIPKTTTTFFAGQGYFYAGKIGDDHLPFHDRGVPVVHLIPIPFPDNWHKIEDDAQHLDAATIHDFALIMSIFSAEYLELGDYISPSNSRRFNDDL